MKNKIKYLALLFLVIAIYSCDDDDGKIEYYDLGANAIMEDTEISRLDQDVDLSIDLITVDGVSVNSIEVYEDDVKITDAIISDSKATFNSSVLLPFLFDDGDGNITEPTGAFDLSMLSALSNGKFIDNDFSIDVVNAITMDDELESVKYLDTTTQEISYSTFTAYATIDEVIVKWKKNKAGTYVEDTNKTLSTVRDTIGLDELDYINDYGLAINDTLYYKFIAKSGVLTDEAITSIAILTQDMNTSVSADLSSSTDDDMNIYNFETGNREDAEIEYDSNGFKISGSTALSFVKFSPTSVDEYFAAGDLFDAEMDFNAGSQQTSFSSVNVDDIFVYKITRDILQEDDDDDDTNDVFVTVVFYGILKIDAVTEVTTNSGIDTKIGFEFKEGTIIRE